MPCFNTLADGAGNLFTDVQGGVTTTYAYNNANRMASFTKGSTTTGTYTYNARGQLVIRNVTNSSSSLFFVASRFISTINIAM